MAKSPLNQKTSYLVEVACNAVKQHKFGRVRYCVEQMLAKLSEPIEDDYREDVRFALLVVSEVCISRKTADFRKLGIGVLRKLASHAGGELQALCQLHLSGLLLCAGCQAKGPETRENLIGEAYSNFVSLPGESNYQQMLGFWYWTRYGQKHFAKPSFVEIYLRGYLFRELGSFPEEDPYIRSILRGFISQHEPIADPESLRAAFEAYSANWQQQHMSG